MKPTFQYQNADGSTTKAYNVGGNRKIRVYESDHGFSVADGDMWLPGLYDSIETARAVADLSDEQIARIPQVWRVDTEDRPATMAEVESARSA